MATPSHHVKISGRVHNKLKKCPRTVSDASNRLLIFSSLFLCLEIRCASQKRRAMPHQRSPPLAASHKSSPQFGGQRRAKLRNLTIAFFSSFLITLIASSVPFLPLCVGSVPMCMRDSGNCLSLLLGNRLTPPLSATVPCQRLCLAVNGPGDCVQPDLTTTYLRW